MEQKTRSKISFGSFFIILLIVIYFGNRGSIQILDKLEETNKKLDGITTEMRLLKAKVNTLEHKKIHSHVSRTTKIEPTSNRNNYINKNKERSVATVSSRSIPKENLENNKSLVDISVVEEERVECCELDEWEEIQPERIRNIINEIVNRENASITTENIECSSAICRIDLDVAGENGMLLIQTIVGKLTNSEKHTTKIKSIARNENEFEVKLELNKLENP